jgi:hypothetical protein
MTASYTDRFDRVDGEIGTNYLVPCGNVTIFDESVYPVDDTPAAGQTGLSPILEGTTARKTQVLLTGVEMDGPDQVVRCVYSHTPEIIGDVDISELCARSKSDPTFTVLARMTKDPLLVDLGGREEPECYDQGYGLRITHPCDGTAPVMELIKFTPTQLAPGIGSTGSSAGGDNVQVLESLVLRCQEMHVEQGFECPETVTGEDPRDPDAVFPYRGFIQEIRLRIRYADDQVQLDCYINDRNLNTPIIEYTDFEHPLWGEKGLPGFEFKSALVDPQDAGVSPFGEEGIPMLVCHFFQAETIRAVRRPAMVHPSMFWTYSEVTKRVILLVEKNGDARYNATVNGQTKMATYLTFVLEAEKDIIRREGYYQWLLRESRVYLKNDKDVYEMPEDLGMIEIVRPGNWNNTPLLGLTTREFHNRLAGINPATGGRPLIFALSQTSVNARKTLKLAPVPTAENNIQTFPSGSDPFLVIEYFARHGRPQEPDVQIPAVPQEHIDVLTYGAAAHAMMLDSDDANAQRFEQTYARKLADLRRENNRKGSERWTVMRSAGDAFKPDMKFRIPLLRSSQLDTLLI